MKRSVKRILAMLMCLCLCFGILPSAVWADSPKKPVLRPKGSAQTQEAVSNITGTSPLIYDPVSYYYADHACEIVLYPEGTMDIQSSDSAMVRQLRSWKNLYHFIYQNGNVAGLQKGGHVLVYGYSEEMTKEIEAWTDIETVCLAGDFVIGLRYDGTAVYSCSSPEVARLFGLDELKNWKHIEQIDYSVCSSGPALVAVDTDGNVMGLGLGSYRKSACDDYSAIDNGRIVFTSGWVNFCLKHDGSVACWGIDSWLYDTDAMKKEKLSAIIPGDSFSIGIREDKSLCYLGNAERAGHEELRDKINACRDVDIVQYSAGTLYIMHTDGKLELVELFPDELNDRLAAMLSNWDILSNLAADRYYVLGLNEDGEMMIVSLYEDSMLESLGVPKDILDAQSYENINVCPDEKVYVDYHSFADFYEVGLCSDGTVTFNGTLDSKELEKLRSWRNVETLTGFNEKLAAITKDGKVLTLNFEEELSSQVEKWDNIVSVFFWNDFVVGLRRDGRMELAVCEDPFFEELNLEDVKNWRDVEQIHGTVHSMTPWLVAKTSSGKVYSLSADYGNEELNAIANLSEPINDARSVGTSGIINSCVHKDGSITVWGPGSDSVLPMHLARRDYVYSLGEFALTKDGTLINMLHDDKDFAIACENVKTVCTDGGNFYALRNDGSVEALLIYHKLNKDIKAQLASWTHIDSIECGYDYVVGRGIDASIQVITTFPNSIF